MTGNPLIAIRNLSVAYDRRIVLHDINLTVNEYDFLGIIGPNGGGKTTLIKTILGLLKPAGGDIRFYRQGMPASSINMGYLPQHNSIDRKFPISVQELVLSGLIGSKKSLTGGFSRLHKEKAQRIISRMGLEGLENRIVGQLSGGQLQRAMLGRAVISEPQVVILDEPNTYIDKRFEDRLYELLAEINREYVIILIDHDIDTVLQNAKSVACVNGTLDYHSDTKVSREWIRKGFDRSSIDL
ncbi:High-affinity zinc uptake system ATP-binding protein ZnuC [termite gut metagenome]|uniref:High-affinity zinc uptake system ATP-binding protein ZnuC n=1 Tax=termite gut metagenome TaxID=433724 RepID=A0A5J4QC55_9ZZZZ